jgi:succinate dehydrogenase/fumarate reductase flavoprotein subunit
MVKAPADGYTSLTLVNALNKALKDAGATVYVNTEATELLTDETGAVCGVKAVGADGSDVEFTGKAVLLATGGFGQNHEMLVEARPDFANAITDEMAPTTGDGIRMATELGAKTVDLAEMQTFPHVPYGDTWLPPMAIPGGFRTTAIYVNQDAQRYTTEGFETADATLQQELAFCIFNEEDLSDNLKLLAARGLVKSADSAAELAEALGLDVAALEATVEQWNADCAAGKDSLFGNESLKPLGDKLCGYRFGVGAHYMMGGLLINGDTQVLDENEAPIPGLYAAGETTGGFHGEVRIDGSGTGDAFTFGHLAGEKIAEAVTK